MQLAVYLRAALQEPSNPSNLRTVCNWQYLIALRTWAYVVSTYHETKQLGPLIHPVVQIALGVIDVFASPRMIPLHLHVVETLNHVAARARVFIPVAPHLMRILTAPAHALTSSLSKVGTQHQQQNQNNNNKKGGSGGPHHHSHSGGGGSISHNRQQYNNETSSSAFTDLQFMLRVKKAYAKSGEYLLNVWMESLYLLTEHLSHMASFISFPESTWQILTSLNKLRREVKSPKINALLVNICKNIEATTTQIKQKRARVNFGPCDIPQVKMFEDDLVSKGTPMAAYYARVRIARMAEFAAKQKQLMKNKEDKENSKKEKKEEKKKNKRIIDDDEGENGDGEDFNVSDLEAENDEDLVDAVSEEKQATGDLAKKSGVRRRR